MSTLVDLNNFSDGVLNYTDARPSNVIFNFPNPVDIDETITTESFTLQRNIDIVEIVQPASALVTFVVDLSNLSGAYATWGTLPSGLIKTQVGQVYTIQGIDSISDWEAVRAPTITIPAGSQGSFEYTCSINYTQDGSRKTKSWTVGTFKPIAALTATASLTVSGTLTHNSSAYMQSAFTCSPVNYVMIIIGRFAMTCQPTQIKGILPTTFTAVSTLEADNYLWLDFATATGVDNPTTTADGQYLRFGYHVGVNRNYVMATTLWDNSWNSQQKLNGGRVLVFDTDGSPTGQWRPGSVADGYTLPWYAVGSGAKLTSNNFLIVPGYNTNGDTYPMLRHVDDLDGSIQNTYSGASGFSGDIDRFGWRYSTASTFLSGLYPSYSTHGFKNRIGVSDAYMVASTDSVSGYSKTFVLEYNQDDAELQYDSGNYSQELTAQNSGTSINIGAVNNAYIVSTDGAVYSTTTGSLLRTLSLGYTINCAYGMALYDNMLITQHGEVWDVSTGSNLTTSLYDLGSSGDGSVAICRQYIMIGDPTNRTAYIYHRLSDFGTQFALYKTLNSPSSNTSDKFGWSVAIDDVTAVVGAVDEDSSNATSAGKIYIYR